MSKEGAEALSGQVLSPSQVGLPDETQNINAMEEEKDDPDCTSTGLLETDDDGQPLLTQERGNTTMFFEQLSGTDGAQQTYEESNWKVDAETNSIQKLSLSDMEWPDGAEKKNNVEEEKDYHQSTSTCLSETDASDQPGGTRDEDNFMTRQQELSGMADAEKSSEASNCKGELNSWAAREGLTKEIMGVLQEEGFTSLSQIKSTLHPDDIKAFFKETHLLNVAQCLALKAAVTKLSEQYGGVSSPSTRANPYSSQPSFASSYTFPNSQQRNTIHATVEGSDEESYTLLLLGKTGSGKSTTGNTILGEPLFDAAADFSSVTSDCERKTNTRNGRRMEIIDSPGLYDTHTTQEEICFTIVKAVASMHPGPHAVLYVVGPGRYTDEEYGAYQRLKALFDDDITKYMIVLFTHGDAIERDKRNIDNMISSGGPETLKQVLKECNNRYIVFNNVADNKQLQVEQLLNMVRHVVAQNGGRTYVCPKYSQIGQEMEEEVARRIQEVEKIEAQRKEYVQQLEKNLQETEERVITARTQLEDSEHKRKRWVDEHEKSRKQLEDQLHAHIKQQQENAEKHQKELQLAQADREKQERMMREKEHEMTEKDKKRAKEAAEASKRREDEMRNMIEKQKEMYDQQAEKDKERIEQLKNERLVFEQMMNEQRCKNNEELQAREEQQRKLKEELEHMSQERARTKQELRKKEMENVKQDFLTKEKVIGYFFTVVGAVSEVIKLGLGIYEAKKKLRAT